MSSPRTRTWKSALATLALTAGMVVAGPVALPASPAQAAADAPVNVVDLMTNGRTEPLGIPGEAPSLSWVSESSARGVMQSAYQVRVATSADALESPDVWDSGKVASDRQVDVAYGGPALESQTRYVWQVQVWDGADQASGWSEPASFETGMLSTEDWGDAAWIGGASGTEVDQWTDYTAEFDFTIDNLVFGAFVRTPNINNGYMWQLSVADGTPRFRPHTKVNGGFALLENKDISSFITAEELRTGQHTMSVTFEGSTITTKLDGETIDTRTDTRFTKGFVGFRSSQATEGTEQTTVHDVRVTAAGGDTLLDTDFATDGNPFSGGTLVEDGLEIKGNLEVLYRSSDDNLPLLRTDFDTADGKSVTRARVYATSRGIYELNLNGDKVGDQFLAPGWTDYADRIQHQSYDVTDLVQDGANSFGAELADGWWGGKVGMWGPGMYGNDLSVVARLRLDYSDGTSEWVDTDDTWTTHSGPYTFTDNIDGETYDARQEQDGWTEPGFDDSAWAPVMVRPSATDLVVPQPDEPVRVTEELDTVERTEPSPAAFVYDLGQNMVGVARMTLQGGAGDTVRIRYGEVLNPDGTLYTANLRAAKVTDYYTFAEDGTVTYEPKFTQHGFRYVEITGAAAPPAATDVTGVVWGSDLAPTGTLETSSPMLNQLQSNISWGQRGNFLSIPTDTPARDERLGWTGDINVFAPTASYLTDTRAFLSKWMTDLRDSVLANGNYPGIAPVPPGIDLGSGLGWSDAAITVPYASWHAQSDTAIVRENYASMKTFLDFVKGGAGADLIDTARGNWDDWLNLGDPTPTGVLGTAYFAEDARMLSEMAAAIGEDADAATYAALSEDVRAAFADEYVAPDGTVTGNSQTAYAMALGMDLVTEEQREAVGRKFVAKLAASDNHLTTGFLGTPWLLPALSSIDRDDLAYTMLMHEDYPSWGYEVANGATTMWERWDSIKPDGSFGDVGMNSFNHYAYGAVGDWMYENIGGIEAIEAGYKKSRIAPNVAGELTRGSGEFESVYGTIATDWTKTDGDLSLAVDVPVNTTAEVVLPAENVWSVTEGGLLLDEVEGVTDVVAEDGEVVLTVGSGSYDFEVTSGNALLGSILDDITDLRAHVADLEDQGDLATGDAETLDGDLSTAADHVSAAIMAELDGDAETKTTELRAALASIQELRAWLADSDVDRPVQGDLDSRLAGIEAKLVRALTSSMGITAALPPVSGAVLPGSVVEGTIEVTNTGAAELTDLEGVVSVDGWKSGTASLDRVPAGESVQLPVSLRVPARQAPGAYDADLELTYTLGEETLTLTDTTESWATVTSGLTIGEVTATMDEADPAERALLGVELTNAGDSDLHGHASAALAEGWASVPSDRVVVPAGETVTAQVPVVVPLDLVGGPMPVTVEFARGDVTLAKADANPSFDLPTPPTAEPLDHVDFGDAESENAHALQASPSSGTNVEAGLSRRYAHSAFPGSWYSVELDVTPEEPFVLRSIETFDGARTKRYNVFVDDTLVKTQLVPRTESGEGVKVHDMLVDDPAVLANDGTVRVKFEYPPDSSGYFDPSLADTWVLPVTDDLRAPDVSAVVSDGTVGDNGWFRSDAEVTVSAADNRDPAPVVETGESSGWQEYVAPVAVSGEGRHTLSFRATDAAGNSSGARELPVWIDATAPTTELSVTQRPGVEEADRASLMFASADELSGVARTAYRIDGGDWMVADGEPVAVEGFGDHVVEYASTDVAGNPEVLRQATVTLADVETVEALSAPQVTGSARFGQVLSATEGSWNTQGLSFAYQWLRNGQAIGGADEASYRLVKADLGKRMSVRVTATKAGLEPGTSTSNQTGAVKKAASVSSAEVNKTKVKRGKPVRVIARVVATAADVAGKVAVRLDRKVVQQVRLRDGRAVVPIRIGKRGRHQITVTYPGSSTVAGSTSPARTVKVS